MRAVKNAGWLTGGRLIADLLSALLFVAISRRFGPPALGAYSYAFAIAGFVLVGSSLGIEPYGVREYARAAPGDRASLLRRLLTTQAASSTLALLVAAIYLVATGASADVVALTLALASYQVALALAQTLFVPASASEAMRGPALSEMLCRAGAVLSALGIIAFTSNPLRVVVLGFPVAGAVLVGLGLTSAWRRGARPRLGAPRSAVGATLRAVWPIAASQLVYQLFSRADLIMLALLAGGAAAGIYASGFKFIEVGITPMIFLASAAYPRLSQLHDQRGDGFSVLGARLLMGSLAVGGVVAWGLLFVVPAFVVPLFGDRFVQAASIVQLMAGLAALWPIESAFSRILLAAHRQVWVLRVHALGAAVNVALNLLLIRRYGVPGAVLASIVALAVMAVTAVWAGADLFPPRTLHRMLWGWAAALGLAVAAGIGAQWMSHSTHLAALAGLAAFLLGMGATSAASGAWVPALSPLGRPRGS
jgi:O-antigen/teichoic acid export membrane protein